MTAEFKIQVATTLRPFIKVTNLIPDASHAFQKVMSKVENDGPDARTKTYQ